MLLTDGSSQTPSRINCMHLVSALPTHAHELSQFMFPGMYMILHFLFKTHGNHTVICCYSYVYRTINIIYSNENSTYYFHCFKSFLKTLSQAREEIYRQITGRRSQSVAMLPNAGRTARRRPLLHAHVRFSQCKLRLVTFR